jgi:ribosomal protein S18 acetylase RimI-like enzyme
MREVQFRRVDSSETACFFDVYAIYLNAFPPEERQSKDILLERFQKGLNELFVLEADQKILAFALLWPLSGIRFTLLDYLAVDSEFRSSGYGSIMLSCLKTEMFDRKKHLVLEVENPDYGSDTLSKQKRIAFYLKNGAVLLSNVRYFIPALDFSNNPVEMRLMLLPKYAITKAECAEIMEKIHLEVYASQTSKELVQRLISELPQIINVVNH